MRVRRFSILLLVICLVRPGIARDLVVDNLTGSDSQNDRGLVAAPATYGPYRTISRALIGALPGDRIILTDTGEPYRECISLVGPNHSGSPAKPFEIIGNGAVLDGAAVPTARNWEFVGKGLWQLNPSPAGHGLVMQGGQLLPSNMGLKSGNLQALAAGSWTRSQARIYVKLEDNQAPTNLPLEVTEQTTGITLYDVENVVIRDLVVRGYRIDGINAHDRCDGISLLNVTTRLNGRSGITVAGASTVTMEATLSEQNGQSQLRVEGRGIAFLGDVDFDDASAEAITLKDAGKTSKLQP